MNDAGSLSSKGRISNLTPPIRVHALARRSENPCGMAVAPVCRPASFKVSTAGGQAGSEENQDRVGLVPSSFFYGGTANRGLGVAGLASPEGRLVIGFENVV